MNLFKTYSKLIFIRNKYNYLLVTLSIIAIFIIMSVLMVYIDNILILSTDFMLHNFRYLYISLRTVFLIGGVTLIISQYYNIMKSGAKDYIVLKSLGATKGTVRSLILIQILSLIFITIPFGLFVGYLCSNLILDFLKEFTLSSSANDIINSTKTLYGMAAAACCLIISIGIYLDRDVNKTPVSSILTDSLTNNKDVSYYDFH